MRPFATTKIGNNELGQQAVGGYLAPLGTSTAALAAGTEMDTSNLTPMAYETISQAGDVLDVLRSEIGASATGKKIEDDFLRGVRTHLRGILRSAREYLDGWNYLDDVNVREFRKGVVHLLSHVEKTLAVPYEQRGKPDFT